MSIPLSCRTEISLGDSVPTLRETMSQVLPLGILQETGRMSILIILQWDCGRGTDEILATSEEDRCLVRISGYLV